MCPVINQLLNARSRKWKLRQKKRPTFFFYVICSRSSFFFHRSRWIFQFKTNFFAGLINWSEFAIRFTCWSRNTLWTEFSRAGGINLVRASRKFASIFFFSSLRIRVVFASNAFKSVHLLDAKSSTFGPMPSDFCFCIPYWPPINKKTAFRFCRFIIFTQFNWTGWKEFNLNDCAKVHNLISRKYSCFFWFCYFYLVITIWIAHFRNGHMLTHRNKKPYECKAEGCGKSYCDARSLRRHTENHHAGSKVNESVSPSSPTTGPHTPNTPGSNPSTPSTPGPTSTQNGHAHTALKQLLATEPTQTQQHKVSFSNHLTTITLIKPWWSNLHGDTCLQLDSCNNFVNCLLLACSSEFVVSLHTHKTKL